MKKGNSIKLKIAVIISIIITIFWLLPYIYVICCSFKPGSEVIAVPPSFLPKSFSVEFHSIICKNERGWVSAEQFDYSSLQYNYCSYPGFTGCICYSEIWSEAVSRLVVLILCLKMIPTSSIAVPIYEIICNMGLYDTRIALIIVYAAVNMPFVMWTMLSFYEGVPSTLDEAAYVDGASSLQTFRKVILPICKPGLATAFIFTLFLAWNDFLISLLLTSMNAKTFTVGLAGFLSAYNLDLGPMCAGAFLFSFPVMILSMFAQRLQLFRE